MTQPANRCAHLNDCSAVKEVCHGCAHYDEFTSLWRPMSEAPKDGSWILILVDTGYQVTMQWRDGMWRHGTTSWLEHWLRAWMPAPPVPEQFPWEEQA